MGIAPHQSRHRSVIAASIKLASDPSTRWRTSPPRSGSVRNRTGAVPGRRPTNSPPLSVGSVRIASHVRSYDSSYAPGVSAGVQRVEQLGVFLVDHRALD